MSANEPPAELDRYQAVVEFLRLQGPEGTYFEFKSNLSEPDKIGRYISGLANSAALCDQEYGYLIWGIDDKTHEISGTSFDHEVIKKGNQSLEPWLSSMLKPVPSFTFHYPEIDGKRVAVLEIGAASLNPVTFHNIAYIRIGSHLKKLHDHPSDETNLYRKLDQIPFEYRHAKSNLDANQVFRCLDTEKYYDLQGLASQDDSGLIIEHLAQDRIVDQEKGGTYAVTNLGGLLFARDLREFPTLERRAPRVIKYKGVNKINAEREQVSWRGYASGFEDLLDLIEGWVPTNEHIESALRIEASEYPVVALRELVANALIHQDFTVGGSGPMIEIYDDRIEMTNPGRPLVEPSRFVDAPPKSRNEKLAAMMRRARICEERGSGWDRIALAIEFHQLPAPEIRVPEDNTVVMLSSPRKLSEMDDEEKIRAVYLHACLQQVSNQTTTNRTIRKRFGLTDKQSSKASAILKLALDAERIVPRDPNAGRKNMEYIPHWAANSRALI